MITKYIFAVWRDIEYIISIFLLPVALLHEAYHYLMAKALYIKIDEVKILSRNPDKPVNYVAITANNWWEAAAVTSAPFVFGTPLFLMTYGLKLMYNAELTSIIWWVWLLVVLSIGAGSVDLIMTFVYLKNAITGKTNVK